MMNNKTISCIVTLAISISFFASSEAGINIEDGKKAVKKLLIRFMRIVMEEEAKDILGLTAFANAILSEPVFGYGLQEVANDNNMCKEMIGEIDDYMDEFRKLLKEPRLDNLYMRSDKPAMPMQSILESLRKTCLEKQNSKNRELQRKKTMRSNSSISLEEHLKTESDKGTPTLDRLGFKIYVGITEVKTMLDALLQLVLDKECTNFKTLNRFTHFMLFQTSLYSSLEVLAPKYGDIIMKEIDSYHNSFSQIIADGDDDPFAIPMKSQLDDLRRGSQQYFTDPYHGRGLDYGNPGDTPASEKFRRNDSLEAALEERRETDHENE